MKPAAAEAALAFGAHRLLPLVAAKARLPVLLEALEAVCPQIGRVALAGTR